MIPNIGNILKQAKEVQEKMLKMQEALAKLDITGQSASGKVTVVISGKNELKSVKLDKSVVNPDDVEMLEDLIMAAYGDAKRKAEKVVEDETNKALGGLKLPPGFSLPF